MDPRCAWAVRVHARSIVAVMARVLGRLLRRRRVTRRSNPLTSLARLLGTIAVGIGVFQARRRWQPPPLEPDVVAEESTEAAPAATVVELPVPARVEPRRRLGAVVALRNLTVILLVGGLSLGACLAAIIPGARLIAVGHHFTAPELKGRLSTLSERTNVYAADGSRIGVLGLEDRDRVALDQVPEFALEAIIATEDKTFHENSGVDLASVFRAIVTNASAGEIEQGGSTITQQLVKNRLFRANRDLDKKIRELVLAYRLNQEYTKDEILEEYVNTVYFGSGAYGIQSAAERFFLSEEPSLGRPRGKRLDELNLAEAALLAAVIANPEGDNPFIRPERALQQRGETLDAMAGEGYITRTEAEVAQASPLPTVPPVPELRPQNYFVEEVQQRLLADPRLGATPEERLERLLRGGLDVHTTLDPMAQFNAQVAVNSVLPDRPPFTAALVAIEPSTGAVRAMVGGPGFEELEYNIVTHAPGRQAGSAWKVITLAAALEAGYSPNDLVNGTSPCRVERPGYGSYDTVNAEPSSGGPMTLRAATTGSVNCAYVRIFSSVGPPTVVDVAHRLGIGQEVPPYLSATLGTIESTPLEMATVAGTIANNGVRQNPYFVHTVVGPDGSVIIDETGRAGLPAIAPEVASCAMDILRGVVTGGTGTRARLADRVSAGKTGTTDRKSDAWFLGFTPQLAATVWHGASTGAVPGAGFGGEYPARIWQAFMSAQLAGQPSVPFPPAGPRCGGAGDIILEGGGRIDPAVFACLFPPPPPAPDPAAPPDPTAPPTTTPAPGPGGLPPPAPCPAPTTAAP